MNIQSCLLLMVFVCMQYAHVHAAATEETYEKTQRRIMLESARIHGKLYKHSGSADASKKFTELLDKMDLLQPEHAQIILIALYAVRPRLYELPWFTILIMKRGINFYEPLQTSGVIARDLLSDSERERVYRYLNPLLPCEISTTKMLIEGRMQFDCKKIKSPANLQKLCMRTIARGSTGYAMRDSLPWLAFELQKIRKLDTMLAYHGKRLNAEDDEITDRLLRAGAAPDVVRGQHQRTLMHTLVLCIPHEQQRLQAYAAAMRLLEHGADINLIDDTGTSVLHSLMCTYITLEQLRSIEATSRYVIDWDRRSSDGRTVLHTTLRRWCAHMVDMQVLTHLIAHCTDINACDHLGNTPLHYAGTAAAAWPEDRTEVLAILQALRDAGADVNLRNKSAKTAWHLFDGQFWLQYERQTAFYKDVRAILMPNIPAVHSV